MTDLWGAIGRYDWPNVGFVSGRPANEEDIQAGRAVFMIQPESEAADISLPACALVNEQDGSQTAVVVIQAEIDGGETLLGVREIAGGNLVCTLGEIEFVHPDKMPWK
ncbi:hypothetical protein HXX25_03255 [Hyphobacterium sp. CCMP332]|uniref:hypothetical protein n=1 Tax=Hyphobacterium sp. CCMP332 TaxID=2749086 RepID=UPI00164F5DFF|nr:hypothetical protein [Hyphobacterium sp. CCMP332]QNL18444.1 hypothetical protein HXX25_03255 [Hyphobacterium sp. CCMP332]